VSPVAAAVVAVLACASLAALAKGLFGSFRRAARAGAVVVLVAGAVALLWTALFFTHSGWAFAFLGLAALCLAAIGGLDYVRERRLRRAVAISTVAALAAGFVTWLSYLVWLAASLRD
jgi:hypothetical protein